MGERFLRRVTGTIADLRRDEWVLAIGFAAYFFLVIATFWILKPLRTAQFLGILGAKNLPWARVVTACIALPVAGLMAFLSARVAHARLVFGVAAVFGAGHLVFWVLDPLVDPAYVHVPFYFWVDVYVTASVALFWSYLNEAMTPWDAKRLYGLIGAGGMAGGIAGSTASGFLATVVGGRHLILLTTVTTAATFPVLALLRRRLRARSAGTGPQGAAAAAAGSGSGSATATGGRVAGERLRAAVADAATGSASVRAAWDGAVMVMRSRYLLGILAVVGLYEVSSVLADYQFSALVIDEFRGEALADERTAYFARFALLTGVFGLAVQLLGTSAIQRRLGVGVALMVLPLAMFGGIAAYLAVPALWSASLWFGADATFNYGIHQSSKEVLYTPTPVHVKYRAKAFIDIFGVRFAKAFGATVIWVLLWLATGDRPRAFVAMGLVALWIGAIWFTSRGFEDPGRVPPVASRTPEEDKEKAPAEPSAARA